MHITNAAVIISFFICLTVVLCRGMYYAALPESLEAERRYAAFQQKAPASQQKAE